MRAFAPVAALILSLALPAAAQPVPYALVASDSVVGFVWNFGQDAVKGRMPVAAADLDLDFANVAQSRVDVSISVVGAEAGFPFASQAMKGPKVLDARQFPQIRFRSERIVREGNGALIDGMMTIRGVTLPAQLHARFYRAEGAQPGDLGDLTLRLTGSVSRSAFGASGWADMVGDEVKLDILAHIRRAG